MESILEITIIIPIHNRILFLPQVLEYYSRAKNHLSPRIIIADSSSTENFSENKKTIDKHENLNIFHLSIQGSGRTLYDKIIGALEYVETEFCVCCADDDFITVSGLKESCDFLKNNPDFIVAHGAYISFNTRLSGKKPRLYWQPVYFNHSVDADSPEKRLTDQFLNYKQTLYAVHRTSGLKYIFEEVRKSLDTETKILLFGELLSSMLAAIRGKIKDLNVFYSARREDAVFQGQHIKWPLVRDYVKTGEFWPESLKFKECIVKNLLAKTPNQDPDKERLLVDEGLELFIKNGLPPDYFRHLVLNTANFLKNKNTPSWFYKTLKKIYRTFVPIKRGGSPNDLTASDLSAYNDDFKTLRDIVLKHFIS